MLCKEKEMIDFSCNSLAVTERWDLLCRGEQKGVERIK